MIGISIAAVAMGLLIPLVRVILDPEHHKHIFFFMSDDGKNIGFGVPDASSPNWPRYRRSLVGLRWKGRSFCVRDLKRLGEVCVLAHPELKDESVLNSPMTSTDPSPELRTEFSRLYLLEPKERLQEIQRSPLHQMDHLPLQ
jgi:hypothetical protein